MKLDAGNGLLTDRGRPTGLLVIALSLLHGFIISASAQEPGPAASLTGSEVDLLQSAVPVGARARAGGGPMGVGVDLPTISLVGEIPALSIFLFFASTSVQPFGMARCASSISSSVMIIGRFASDRRVFS